jgi:hypothetical protein
LCVAYRTLIYQTKLADPNPEVYYGVQSTIRHGVTAKTNYVE